jgi:hypothetical protein
MLRHLKLSHHAHTGSRRPHEHTSYVALFLLLTIVGASLTMFTSTAFLASPGPELRSVGLTGVVPGKPPTVAATISSPSNGTRFSKTPITVTGTCPENMLVELFKNKIFAGSVMCSSDGKYTIEIDLLVGKNILTAHVYDSLNQEGPTSDPITVYYDFQPSVGETLAPLSFGGDQLVLNTDAVFRGTFPNESLSVPLDILGGRGPYALNVQWGDASNKVVSRPTNQSFRVDHKYAKSGTYSISVQATDADGRVAFLTVAAIINGQPFAAATTATVPDQSLIDRLLVLWPLYVIAVTMVTSFWLGERREKQVLAKHGLLIQPR